MKFLRQAQNLHPQPLMMTVAAPDGLQIFTCITVGVQEGDWSWQNK